jgi:hypothetical protein
MIANLLAHQLRGSQNERCLAWATDDFLVLCERPGTALQKLVGQVKRTFAVSAADDDFKGAIQDFWADFNDQAKFSPPDDRLVLLTLRGSEVLLNGAR